MVFYFPIPIKLYQIPEFMLFLMIHQRRENVRAHHHTIFYI